MTTEANAELLPTVLPNDGTAVVDSEDYDETPPVLPPRQNLPCGVKVCGVVTMFVIAVIVGSTGHAAYEAVFATIGEAEYVASAALIGGIDHSVDICDDPWTFFCGKYDEAHYMSGSTISDLSIVEWKRALKAFQVQKTGQASLFYDECMTQNASDVNTCDALYGNNVTLRWLWRSGITHSNIGISRMANPNPGRSHERSVVMWTLDDVSATDVYPITIGIDNDPCDLVELFNLVMCPDWASREVCLAPLFLVSGSVDKLCDAWIDAQTDPLALENARNTALKTCYKRVSRLNTPLDCFLQTAEFYPETNLPYLANKGRADSQKIQDWFERARNAVIEVAGPLGNDIVQRLKDVKLNAEWTAQNLPTPPAQLMQHSENGSFINLIAAHDAWQMETFMKETVQVYPRWAMDSWSINAYYSPGTNEIYVPDAMTTLLNPLETSTAGTLLFILSHELGHSFDPTSTALNENLISEPSKQVMYANTKKCLMSDYVNANETIGEDFADFIGIQALKRYVSNNLSGENDIKVKERSYTPAQQSLAAFGKFWCASTDNEASPGENRDPHSLPRDRVEQAVSRSISAFGYGTCSTRIETCDFV